MVHSFRAASRCSLRRTSAPSNLQLVRSEGSVQEHGQLGCASAARTTAAPLRQLWGSTKGIAQQHSLPRTLRNGRGLQARHFHPRQVVAALGTGVAEESPEPGTPEAPPQVPPSFEHVPGTSTPTEEFVPPPTEQTPAAGLVEPTLNHDEELPVAAVADPIAADTATGLTDAAASGGAPAEQPASTPEQQAFRQAWAELMAKLEAHGFYDALNEDGEPMSKIGAVKRTLLNCGRQRPDAFYDLDADKLRAFVSSCSEPVAGALKDRKAVNSMRRLQATVIGGRDLGIGDGGAASFLDVCRVLWALWSDTESRSKSALVPPGLVPAGASLLPNIISVIDTEPTPEALAKHVASEKAREQAHAEVEAKKADRYVTKVLPSQRGGAYGQQNGRSERSYGQEVTSSNPNARPGDWDCEECGVMNFARNRECFKCQAARPAGAGPVPRPSGMRPGSFRPGDWECAECHAHNFANRDSCYECGSPKMEGAAAFGGAAPSSYARRDWNSSSSSNTKPGDWNCTSCNASNFARRSECYKCGEPRSDASPVAGGGHGQSFYQGARGPPRIVTRNDQSGGMRYGGAATGHQQEVRPGDWRCPECSAHNYASKDACYRCHIPKPPGSEMVAEGGRGSSSSYGRTSNFGRRGGDSWSSPRQPAGAGRFRDAGVKPEDLEW